MRPGTTLILEVIHYNREIWWKKCKTPYQEIKGYPWAALSIDISLGSRNVGYCTCLIREQGRRKEERRKEGRRKEGRRRSERRAVNTVEWFWWKAKETLWGIHENHW
jgi:hypothetical protein